ncbi:MAG: type II toxin-antitoxin system RelE/ParE family toxin [Balneolaceae bacterium]|nr:type II toxin-antitoxin system RelE/ParE family toxin [Balneolaceae bacterium]
MSISLILTPHAEKDFDIAYEWYEHQDSGLGKEFARCVDVKIAHLHRNPFHYQIIANKDVRRALVSRFPYSIYFISEPELITIFAILHQHQNPENWKSRT